MTALQIQYFIEIVRHGGFIKAAQKLYVTQPTISRQIAALEQELGYPLFDRTQKGAQLTEAGKLYYECFSDFSKKMEETAVLAEKSKLGLIGRIKVGFVEGWNVNDWLLRACRNLREHYPGIKVTFEIYPLSTLIRKLQDEELDAVICMDILAEHMGNLEQFSIAQIPNILIYSANHSLADKPDLAPKDFCDDTLYVVAERDFSLAKEHNENLFSLYGFRPNVVEMPNHESILFALSEGHGYAVFDIWQQAVERPEFRHIQLEQTLNISYLFKKRYNNNAIRLFANELRFALEQKGQERRKAPAKAVNENQK